MGLWATEARAAVNVSVGYADSLRPSGFFPNPWIGASGVVSLSSGAQTFDAGAIRIDNTGASPITITGFTVTLNGGSTVFNSTNVAGWGTSLVIPAGEDGIFTQTAQYNFDTSDFAAGTPPSQTNPNPGKLSPPAPGNNGIGGCSSPVSIIAMAPGYAATCDSTVPTVSFSVDGAAAQMFDDSGHILDTGHYDFINGSADGNESIAWQAIGSVPTRGLGGVPEPSTWALMLIGFAGLAFAAFRTKKGAGAALAA